MRRLPSEVLGRPRRCQVLLAALSAARGAGQPVISMPNINLDGPDAIKRLLYVMASRLGPLEALRGKEIGVPAPAKPRRQRKRSLRKQIEAAERERQERHQHHHARRRHAAFRQG